MKDMTHKQLHNSLRRLIGKYLKAADEGGVKPLEQTIAEICGTLDMQKIALVNAWTESGNEEGGDV